MKIIKHKGFEMVLFISILASFFDDNVQFWQAGKGVGGIKSIESCEDILNEYKI